MISSHTMLTPNPVADNAKALLQEIFSSIQGEGIFVGKRQIFIRFAHCHLKCAYCDTSMTTPTGQCHLEAVPGSGTISYLENPMTAELLFPILEKLNTQAKHHSISFTGGEPLLYHKFLKELLPLVRPLAPSYLETSGTQSEFLQHILPWVDIIAMDIKLPSATQEPPQFENHARFYEMAVSNPDTRLFIKLIFNGDTTREELEAVCDIVKDRTLPIILQPQTNLEDQSVRVKAADLFRIENTLSQTFQDVRVIPQTHKMMKVL